MNARAEAREPARKFAERVNKTKRISSYRCILLRIQRAIRGSRRRDEFCCRQQRGMVCSDFQGIGSRI